MMNLFGRLPGTIVLAIEGEKVKTGNYGEFFFLLAASIGVSVILFFLRDRIARYFTRILHTLKRRMVFTLHRGAGSAREPERAEAQRPPRDLQQ